MYNLDIFGIKVILGEARLLAGTGYQISSGYSGAWYHHSLSFCSAILLSSRSALFAGAIEPTSKHGGQQQAAMTLQENLSHQFSCHSEGWDPHNRPLITWYLNGKWQKEQLSNHRRLVMTSESDSEVIDLGYNHNSTFSLRPRKWNRELVCVASNPRTGEKYNATITLSLQCESSSSWSPLFCPETVNKTLLFLIS